MKLNKIKKIQFFRHASHISKCSERHVAKATILEKAKISKVPIFAAGTILINPTFTISLINDVGSGVVFKYPPILWYSSSPKVETDSSFLEREPDLMTHLEGMECG